MIRQSCFRVTNAAMLLPAVLALLLAGSARAQTPAQAGVPVSAAPVTRRDVPVILRNIGSVQALNTVLIRARVDGTLDKVLFREGQDVKAGELLAQIDPRPYAATLAQAEAKKASDVAQLANAQRDLARYASLARQDFASRQQLDTQQATVAQLQATLQGDDATIAAAQLNLDFTHITSPLDGRTGLRLVDAGNLIHATDSTGIVSVAQVHPISVIFTLPQQNVPDIQSAMAKHKLSVIAYTQDDQTELARGELLTMDNAIDTSTGTIRLKAIFPNTDDRLWPGQFANVRLQLDTMPNVLTIPSIAVQHGPNSLFAYVIMPDSTVTIRPIDVRQDDGSVAVVTKGLDEGAQVVTNGQSRIQAGTQVSVQPAKAAS